MDRQTARWSPELFRHALRVTETDPRPIGTRWQPWQTADFRALDPAWKHLAGIARRRTDVIQRAYFERPRGHSKTFDTAVQITWILLAARQRVTGLAAASDREQAALLHQSIERLARLNPHLTDCLTLTSGVAANRRTGSMLKIISSDVASSWGHDPDFVICDELCHWTSEDLWHSLVSSAAKRPHGLLLVLANAGFGRGWQWDVREAARLGPQWHFSSLDGPSAPWITEAQLAEQRRLLPPSVFDRLWMNRWQHSDGEFVTLAEAEACRDPALREQSRGHPGCSYIGVIDYAEKHDFTAACVCHLEGGRVIVDRMDVVCPRPQRPTPVSWVEDWMHRMASSFAGIRFVVDEYQLLSAIQRWESRYAIRRFAFQSGRGNHALAMTLRNLILQRKVAWYEGCGAVSVEPRDDLETELASLVVRESASGLIRIDHLQDGRHHDDRAFVLGAACLELMQQPDAPGFLQVTPPAGAGEFGWL